MSNTAPEALTWITTCKGRLAHLQQTLPRIASQPGVRCLVVDYDCPDGTAAWVKEHFPSVHVVHVTDQPGWNVSRARNLGVAAATTPWIAVFDADILIDPSFTAEVLPLLTRGCFFRPNPPTRQTWGSFICEREAFDRAGGYDETYHGWGGEDDDLFDTLQVLGYRVRPFPATLVSEIPHPDELRTRFYSQDMLQSHRVHQYYKHVKLDVLRLTREPLSAPLRRQIYDSIREKLSEIESGVRETAVLSVNLPSFVVAPPPSDRTYTREDTSFIDRKIQYRFRVGTEMKGP